MKNPFKTHKTNVEVPAAVPQAMGSGPWKIDTRHKVREVAGEHIVMQQCDGADDMSRVVALNETALMLYNRLKEQPFGLDDVVAALTEEYDVDAARAEADAQGWIEEMCRLQLAKEC